MLRRRTLLGSALAVAIASIAIASVTSAQNAPTIQVEQAWARASAGQIRTGAAYMTLVNTGAGTDRLVQVATPIAEKAELHTHVVDGDVMRMRPVAAIEVNPGEPSVLKPGGLHVMLMGLKAPLKAGEEFSLTLIFEKAGKVQVNVAIGAAGALGPDTHQHKSHGS